MRNKPGTCCFILATLLFSCIPTSVFSQTQAGRIMSPELQFTAWLMNNEARTMSILAYDRITMERMSQPFAFFGAFPASAPRAEHDLWEVHLKYYKFLPQVVEIAELAQRFGSGKFAPVFERTQPGAWLTAPFSGTPTFLVQVLNDVLDNTFKRAVRNAFGIDGRQDADLAERLKKSEETMDADQRRLLKSRLETFLALYPNSNSIRMLSDLVNNGIKKSAADKVALSLGFGTPQTASASFAFDIASEPASKTSEITDSEITATEPEAFPADLFDILK